MLDRIRGLVVTVTSSDSGSYCSPLLPIEMLFLWFSLSCALWASTWNALLIGYNHLKHRLPINLVELTWLTTSWAPENLENLGNSSVFSLDATHCKSYNWKNWYHVHDKNQKTCSVFRAAGQRTWNIVSIVHPFSWEHYICVCHDKLEDYYFLPFVVDMGNLKISIWLESYTEMLLL